MSEALLELREVSKSFGAVRALEGASLHVRAGEIHALLGENGAGKTTLVSIAAGLLAREAGEVRIGGGALGAADPRRARALGLALVPQHDLLVPAASVADNLALLDPEAPRFTAPRARRQRVRLAERATGLSLGDPDAPACSLSVAARQRVGIAAALLNDPKVLVLDEPTAVLAPQEARALFDALEARAQRGRSVVLITHRLPEVFEVANRLTLLARGRTVLESAVKDADPSAVAALLLGGAEAERPLEAAPPAPSALPALECEALVPEGTRTPPASLRLLPGEALALLAIDGNGAEEIASAIAGARRREGRVGVAGRAIRAGDVAAFRAAGGAFVPGDRLAEGLVPELTVAENLALVARGRGPLRPLLDRRGMDRLAEEAIERFGIRTAGPRAPAGSLSGGNQQKLLLARELSGAPRLVVAVHPTRGLDLGGTAEVHRRLAAAREAGTALLVVTADPEEARLLGGVIRVVYRGTLSPALPASTPLSELGRRLSGLAA